MRVGIDARPATEIRAGIGTYVRELLTEFEKMDHGHQLYLYSRSRWPGLSENDERVTWRLLGGSDVPWNLRTARRASRECDVYLSTISYLSPWFLTIPSVLVVHDMIAFDSARLPNRRSALVERATIRPALRRAGGVITISDSTRRDLVGVAPRVASKVRVVLDAAEERFTAQGDTEAVARKHELNRPFVLAVGTLEPRKNLPRLIEAYATLPDDLRAEYDLVLVGASGWGSDETFGAIARFASSVRTLGYVDDEDLPALYRRASLLAFPSIYEGFGFPVLEAMQSGTPVLTTEVSSIPEVGGDAVRYADPFSVNDLRCGLEELLRDPGERSRMSALGLERAELFSWKKTASETLEVLESAA